MDTAIFAPRLAARLAPAATPEDSARFLIALLRALSAGVPVAPADLARTLGWPLAGVRAALARAAGIERAANGDVEGYALTLRPTACEFLTGARPLYAWCAFDTLFFPPLLGVNARVRSRCAVTGAPITLTATPEGIRDLQPAGAAISMLLPAAGDDVRSGFCCRVRYFASVAAGREWAASRPEIEILPAAEVATLARATAVWLLERAGSSASLPRAAAVA